MGGQGAGVRVGEGVWGAGGWCTGRCSVALP